MEILLEKPYIYKPEENEKHNNFRSKFMELYHPYNDYMGTERPVVVVSAFEDDQYFSEETKGYVSFGLELASRIALLDPSGVTNIVISVLRIAWAIVCFIDWMDENDYIGTTTYQFFPTLIPEGTDRSHPYSKEVDITLRKGKSIWKYRIEFISRGVVYIE